MMRTMKQYAIAGVCGMALTTGVLAGCTKITPVQTPPETTTIVETTTIAETTVKAPSETMTETTVDSVVDAETEGESEMQLEAILIYGQLISVNEEEKSIAINNQSENSAEGEVVIYLSDEQTRLLDAINGFPVQPADLKEGEMIYAYIGPAMTMSLPPQTNASVIFCQIPETTEDGGTFKVPEFVKVKEMVANKDESFLLTATVGMTYQVPEDCEISPYLTRNIVRLQDVTAGSNLLVWSDENGQATKIVLFAE